MVLSVWAVHNCLQRWNVCRWKGYERASGKRMRKGLKRFSIKSSTTFIRSSLPPARMCRFHNSAPKTIDFFNIFVTVFTFAVFFKMMRLGYCLILNVIAAMCYYETLQFRHQSLVRIFPRFYHFYPNVLESISLFAWRSFLQDPPEYYLQPGHRKQMKSWSGRK